METRPDQTRPDQTRPQLNRNGLNQDSGPEWHKVLEHPKPAWKLFKDTWRKKPFKIPDM